jgi:hypothetical protein
MLNFKSGLFAAIGLVLATCVLDANAITRVAPVPQPILAQSSQTVADAAGPTTGGGDTPYLSSKPGAEPSRPTDTVPPQAAAPTAAVKAADPAVPPAPPTAEKSPEAQSPPAPAPAAAPAPQAAPEAPVPAATPVPQPIKPQIPLEAADPTPVEPQKTPVQTAVPEPVAPAAPPAVAVQPKPAQPAAVIGSQEQKPKQKLANKKPKPVQKPDVIVRNGPPGPVHRVPDDSDTVYEDGPIPPMPIGRRHIVVEADNGYDDGYVVVRRYHRCESHFVPGFWLFHREEVRCY